MGKTEDRWLKDVDIARAIENTLTGVVVFFGALVRTTVAVVRGNDELFRSVVTIGEFKVYEKVRFVRPLSFFVLWWGVVLVFAYGDAGTVVFLKAWLQANPWVTAGLPDRLGQLASHGQPRRWCLFWSRLPCTA